MKLNKINSQPVIFGFLLLILLHIFFWVLDYLFNGSYTLDKEKFLEEYTKLIGVFIVSMLTLGLSNVMENAKLRRKENALKIKLKGMLRPILPDLEEIIKIDVSIFRNVGPDEINAIHELRNIFNTTLEPILDQIQNTLEVISTESVTLEIESKKRLTTTLYDLHFAGIKHKKSKSQENAKKVKDISKNLILFLKSL